MHLGSPGPPSLPPPPEPYHPLDAWVFYIRNISRAPAQVGCLGHPINIHPSNLVGHQVFGPLAGSHGAEGFLSIGPYARDDDDDAKLEFTNLIFGYAGDDRRRFVYSLQQLDMMVFGQQLDVDPSVYTMQMMIVDSGTPITFLLAPVFDALDKAVTAAMAAKGYGRARHQLQDEENTLCFWVPGDMVDWSDLPTVEMKFTAETGLKLPLENVFDQRFIDSDGRLLCLPIQPRGAGVNGVQILGNKATRTFRVVFDLQMFGFQPDAC
ncbi:uncharacterized protein [Miscanthus floridulus]|uniref:uncharacterized protein n=1 Tax=Miscanthus floridulus TaxID=154761 RepID=UPI00345818C9